MDLPRVKIGSAQKKILTTLLAGVAIGLSYSPKRQLKILLEELPSEWAKIDIQTAEYGLHKLYKSKYIGIRKNEGVYEPYLKSEGKKRAVEYSLESITISPKKWDGFWRIVIFDVPEKFKKRRNILRFHLKRLGFKEIQKSVFCLPYECGREITMVVEGLRLRNFVEYIVAKEISKEQSLKQYFNL